MGSPLLEYAEALRTGRNLARARKVRPYLLKTSPVSVTSLDEVMPHAYTERERHAPSGNTPAERRQAFVSRNAAPEAPRRTGPTQSQVAEIERLSRALGRPPWIPPKPWQASAEINRLRQVRANTRT